MKILLFQANPIEFPGGCEKYIVDLARGESARGHSVIIGGSSPAFVQLLAFVHKVLALVGPRKKDEPALPEREPTRVARETGRAAVRRVRWREIIPITPAARRYRRMVRDADAIYTKNEFTDLALLRLFLPASMLDKLIIGVHSSIFLDESMATTLFGRIHNLLYGSRFYREHLRRCAAIHVPNAAYVDLIARHYDVPVDKIVHVAYPLDPARVVPSPRTSGPTLRVLFAQRMTPQKGVDYLCELVERLNREAPGTVEVTIAGGSGELEPLVIDLAARHANVSYRGYVSDMPALYAAHDLALVPSRWEMFPYSVLEPLGAGLPVVAFDIPGPRDMIVDRETGVLVPLGDVDALFSTLVDLARRHESDPDALAAMGRRGRQVIEERYGRDAVFARMDALFAAVAAGRPVGDTDRPVPTSSASTQNGEQPRLTAVS